MKLSTRLLLAWAGTVVVLLLPAFYAVERLAEVQDITAEQRGRHSAAFVAMGRFQTAISDLERYQRSYIATPDPELRLEMNDALLRARRQLVRLGDVGYGELGREAGARLDTLELETYRVTRLVEAGRLDEATRYYGRLGPRLDALRGSVDQIARAIDRRSFADVAEAEEISAEAASAVPAALLVAGVIAAAIGLWTTRHVADPMRRLSGATAQVAGGEFATPAGLPYDRDDEVGDLSRSFRTMTDRLADLERMRADFMGMATHDLKTPIGVIGGYAELIETGVYGEVTEKQRGVLESIRDQTEVLTGLVQQLLDISRAEAGRLPVELQEIELPDYLARIERTYQGLAEQKRIDFSFRVEPSVPDRILADPDRLRDQVLGNLFSNAFKFTPEGGRVSFRAWADPDELHLEVSDTGPGIPQEDLPHIFEKYYQASRTERARGTGLGLAIVRQIVEDHGGRIDVRSRRGRGTTFHIVLPIRRAVPVRDRPAAA